MLRSCLNGATTMTCPLEQDLENAAQAGFEGVELWWDKIRTFLETRTAEDLKALLDHYALVPVSICPLLIWPFRDSEPARESFRSAVSLAPLIGCDLLIACPDFRPARLTKEEALAAHARELRSLAEIASQRGLRLAVEPIGRHTLCAGSDDALALIERAGNPENVGLLLDSFHFFRSQIENAELDRIPLDKLFVVHVNDSEDGAIDELTDANRVYPLEGVIPLGDMLGRLVARGYDGYLSVEVFRPEYWEQPGLQVAKQAAKSLTDLTDLLSQSAAGN